MKLLRPLALPAVLVVAALAGLGAGVKISDLALSTSPSTNTFMEIADLNASGTNKSAKVLYTNFVTHAQLPAGITNALRMTGTPAIGDLATASDTSGTNGVWSSALFTNTLIPFVDYWDDYTNLLVQPKGLVGLNPINNIVLDTAIYQAGIAFRDTTNYDAGLPPGFPHVNYFQNSSVNPIPDDWRHAFFWIQPGSGCFDDPNLINDGGVFFTAYATNTAYQLAGVVNWEIVDMSPTATGEALFALHMHNVDNNTVMATNQIAFLIDDDWAYTSGVGSKIPIFSVVGRHGGNAFVAGWGAAGMNVSNAIPSATWEVDSWEPSRIVSLVKGASGQTNSLQQWQDYNSNIVASVSASGLVVASGFSSTATDAAVALTSTGITNALGKNAMAYFDGTALTFTLKTAANAPFYTNSVSVGHAEVMLQNGEALTVTSGTATGVLKAF